MDKSALGFASHDDGGGGFVKCKARHVHLLSDVLICPEDILNYINLTKCNSTCEKKNGVTSYRILT